MIIATAGHIDHGKTSLVQALTGVNTDNLPEEKKRGMSIDLGFAYCYLKSGQKLGFVDVPGHERFIKNMLAGVTGVDCALLVVAADDGPMPQTREHLDILNLLNISDGVVALTKADRVDGKRLLEVKEKVKFLISTTCLKDAEIIPVSSVKGFGLDKLRGHLEILGGLFEQTISDGYFRMAIDRCFTIQGTGLVVTGAVFSGGVAVGDELIISPEGYEVRVRGIHSQNEASSLGSIGQRCAVNITGSNLKKSDIKRGRWLLDSELHKPVSRFDAMLNVLKIEHRPLRHWTPVHVHLGASETMGRVAILSGDQIKPESQGLVQFVLDQKTSVLKGDGFILRDQNARRTIAGGVVVDPFSPTRGRSKSTRIEYLESMLLKNPEDALIKILDQHPKGVDFNSFVISWNLKKEHRELLLESTPHQFIGSEKRGTVFSPQNWREFESDILLKLENWHNENSDSGSCNLHSLKKISTIKLTPPVFEDALDFLVSTKQINSTGGGYSLSGFEAVLSKKDSLLWDRVRPFLENDLFQPPVVTELSVRVEIRPKMMSDFLIKLAKLGRVFQVSKNRFLLPEAIIQLAKIAKELGDAKGADGFSAAEFRDSTGIGRNLAIEVLEYFDRSGLTWRSGNVRTLLKEISEVFGDI